MHEKIKDIIYLDDVRDEIDYAYSDGINYGTTTYINELDEIFKWMIGNVIVFGGIMNHGKSTFLNQLMIKKSINDGCKWAIFTPESNPASYYYADLMRMYLGKSVIKGHKNLASMQEKRIAADFINEHFFYLYPENDSPTPEYINNRFKDAILTHGVNGCVIDPFNQLDNDWRKEGRDDLYISKFLSNEKRFAVENKVYKIIVTHPKVLQKQKGSLDYDMPDVFDFHGGSMWGNKADDIIVVHRPLKSSNPKDCLVKVKSIKIKKQPYCGTPGEIDVLFSIEKNQFFTNGVEFDEEIKYKINNNKLEF